MSHARNAGSPNGPLQGPSAGGRRLPAGPDLVNDVGHDPTSRRRVRASGKAGVTAAGVCERLTMVSMARHSDHWTGLSATQAAEITRRDVVGEGVCLPMVRFCEQPVLPVVGWDLTVLAARLTAGQGPCWIAPH